MKFKLGDRVKVIDPIGHYRVAKMGDIGIVVRTWNNGSDGIDVKTSDGRVMGMFCYRFVLAEPKIIKQYGIVDFMKGTNVKV